MHSPITFGSSCLLFPYEPTTEIYTLSLHDALPISSLHHLPPSCSRCPEAEATRAKEGPTGFAARWDRVVFQRRMRMSERRSEEHTSELQSLRHLVCRLLLEKKK